MPKPLDEMRSPEDRFMQIDEVRAAAGVLIATPKIEGVVAGSPVLVATEQDLDKIVKSVQEEVESLRIQRKGAGVVIKADTLGSLEALVSYVERQGIPVRFADVGPVVHRDVVEAQITKNEDRLLAAILAFNVKVTEEAEVEAKASGIEIFRGNIIYKLVEDLLEWRRRLMEEETKKLFEKVVLPAKIKILPGYVFRRRDPIIVGVEVLEGRIRKGIPLMKEDGRRIGEIMQIQEHNQPISEATKGMAVAISIRSKAIVGRQVKEGEILYSDVPIEDIRIIEERFLDLLSNEEKELLRYIKKIKLKSLRAKLG